MMNLYTNVSSRMFTFKYIYFCIFCFCKNL